MNKIKEKVKGFMKSKSTIKTYTLLFIVISLCVFFYYIIKNKTFIWKVDGWDQHYKAMVYYGKYLRQIFENIFVNHQFSIPAFDFAIGEGSDILQTLHYYVIGDPFTFLTVIIPEKFTHIYYDAVVILKLYLSGLFFILMCKNVAKKNISSNGMLAGAICYVFCFWQLLHSGRHPFFLNPMVYLPLVILGIERILQGKKPFIYILSIFVVVLSNFYFFYMIALMVALYTILRLIAIYKKDVKSIFKNLFKILGYSIIGTLMASVIFIPQVYGFLGNSRVSTVVNFQLIYPLEYYLKLPRIITTAYFPYYLCIGMPSIVLLASLMVYIKKGNKFLKVLLSLCIVFVLFPIFGQIFNGFGYVSNRWCFALNLLLAFIISKMWSDLMQLEKKQYKIICILLIIYAVTCFFKGSIAINTIIHLIIVTIMMVILCPKFSNKDFIKKHKEKIIMVLIILSVIINGYLYNSSNQYNYTDKLISSKNINEKLYENETKYINKIAESENIDKKSFRYTGNSISTNANIMAGISNTQFYWSISNPTIDEYKNKLGLLDYRNYASKTYDDRTIENELSSVRYYVLTSTNTTRVPYGYELKEEDDKYKIYENKNPLPLAYTYNSYIKKEDWNKLDIAKKRETMLQSAVVEEDVEKIEKKENSYTSESIPFKVKNSKKVKYEDNKFIVKENGGSITLKFDGKKDCETYLLINNLQYTNKKSLMKENSQMDIKCTGSNNVIRTINYLTKDNMYYSGKHDYMLNYNYNEKGLTKIKIKFFKKGTYTFDSLKVICQSMKNYNDQVYKLKENTLENMQIATDSITGTINLNQQKLLVFSVPYSKGWTALVDGKEVPIIKANIKNMAINIEQGEHKVELKYKTPMLNIGYVMSIMGVIIFLLITIFSKNGKYRFKIDMSHVD